MSEKKRRGYHDPIDVPLNVPELIMISHALDCHVHTLDQAMKQNPKIDREDQIKSYWATFIKIQAYWRAHSGADLLENNDENG